MRNDVFFSDKYVYFSIGEYIREKLKDFSGEYLHDDIIKEKINDFSEKNVIFDGFQRIISQF